MYEYRCRNCGQHWTERRSVDGRDAVSVCPGCESDWTYRAIGAGVHTAPVAGTGNWRYARKLEERAEIGKARAAEKRKNYKRLAKGGGVDGVTPL